MNLYEMLKARKVGWSNDFLTNIYAKAFGGSQPASEHEYTGAVPYTFTADGTPLLDWYIKGNMSQTGTPTPSSPIQPQECGDLETSGAKAGQYKITISSASTTTPVYLGEVQTTRRVKKLVLTGGETEAWSISDATKTLYLAVSDHLTGELNICFCTHYKSISNVSSIDMVGNGEITFHNSLRWLYIKDNNYNTVADFKSYLAQQYANGTPVTVWYVLATEETGIVNEPLRKIGDYADMLTATQADVSIPTNNGNTTIDIDTTLKPSEVYIKYMG